MTPAPRESAAETLARAIRLWDAVNEYTEACGGDTSNATISGRRMNAVVRVNEEVGREVVAAIREAVREVHGDMDACEHGPEQVQDSWRFEGLSDALDAFKERLAPLGLWPEEGEG